MVIHLLLYLYFCRSLADTRDSADAAVQAANAYANIEDAINDALQAADAALDAAEQATEMVCFIYFIRTI